MEKTNKIIIAILLGALIIGGFVFVAMAYKPYNKSNYANNYSTLGAKYTSSTSKTATCQAADNTIVTKVIDGDTVVVEGGSHIRLLGIDADEKNYPCYDAAKLRLEALVLSKQVTLQKDITDTDQYGRCLRTIFIGTQNIDLQLVKEGLAVARFYEPDVKYKDEISSAEKQAIESKAGCKWSGVTK